MSGGVVLVAGRGEFWMSTGEEGSVHKERGRKWVKKRRQIGETEGRRRGARGESLVE